MCNFAHFFKFTFFRTNLFVTGVVAVVVVFVVDVVVVFVVFDDFV